MRYIFGSLFFCFICFSQQKAQVLEDEKSKFLNKISPVVVAITHEEGTGSGFIVSKDGYILTNGHVAHGSDSQEPLLPIKPLTVTLWNEQKYQAEVVGLCLDPDVALLKIKPNSPLKVAKADILGDVKAGDTCYALGSSYGINRTLTKGIISRTGSTHLNTFTPLYQIDAIINPGNSGGPLFNKDGIVIGINTYRSKKSGFGYSIPIGFALFMKEHFIKYGRFIRSDIPYFFARAMTKFDAQYYQTSQGVLIEHVRKGSYAWQQGLRETDIIIKMNGKEVVADSEQNFYNWIWDISILPVDSQVDLTVLRQQKKGSPKEINLSIKLLESDPLPAYSYQFGEIPEYSYDSMGFKVQPINPLLWYMNRLYQDYGVVISSVAKGSSAGEAGLKNRSVILRLNGKKVRNFVDFKTILRKELLQQKKFLIFKTANKNDISTNVLALRYRIKNKKVLIITDKQSKFLPLYCEKFNIGGAKVTIVQPNQDFGKASHWDAILLTAIKVNSAFDKKIRNFLKGVQKRKTIIAGDGQAPLLFYQLDDYKKAKMTIDKKVVTEKFLGNYTGADVEKDKNLITTTASDRKVAVQYINTVIDVIYKYSFK